MGEIITYHAQPTPQRVYNDLVWASQRRGEHYRTCGACVVVISGQQILGVGKTREDAIQAAEQRAAASADDVEAIMDDVPEPRIGRILRGTRSS